jgi:hypothetical protein
MKDNTSWMFLFWSSLVLWYYCPRYHLTCPTSKNQSCGFRFGERRSHNPLRRILLPRTLIKSAQNCLWCELMHGPAGKNRHTFCRSRTVFKYCCKMCMWSHGLNIVHCSRSMTHRTVTLNIRNGTSWINMGNSIEVPVHKFPSSLTVCFVDFLCSCEMITEASRWYGILSYKKWSAWRWVGMCTT